MPAQRPYRGSARGRTRSRSTGMTQSPGWLRPDQIETAETVIARYHRDHLATGLSALHGRGMGHTARVLDPARGPIEEQFRRAGIAADLGFGTPGPDDVFILVSATGRSTVVGDLLLDSRAREVRVYQPSARRDASLTEDVIAVPSGDGADTDMHPGA